MTSITTYTIKESITFQIYSQTNRSKLFIMGFVTRSKGKPDWTYICLFCERTSFST